MILRANSLILASLLFPALAGAQILTRGEVYNFDPGDVFQSRSQQYALWAGPPTYQTDSIMSEEWSTGMEMVTYQVHRHIYQLPLGPGLPSYSHDTVIFLSYEGLDLPAIHFQGPNPCLPVLDSLGTSAQYCGRTVWVKFTAGDTCFEPDTWTSTLVAGCGGPYYVSSEPSGPQTTIFTLLYYRKGNEECGMLISGFHSDVVPWPSLVITPNPGTTGFQLSGLLTRAMVRIYDLQGRMVLDETVMGDGGRMATAALSVGSYVVEVRTNDGQLQRLRWVKE